MVSVRGRGNKNLGVMPLEEFIAMVQKAAAEHAADIA